MDGLTEAIKRCDLQLRLDNRTEGFGNCFPNAIVQQCRRPEIREWLQQKKPVAIFNHHQCVRNKVTNFAVKSTHKSICDMKTTYGKEIEQVDKRSWTEYWDDMAEDGTWVDHMFVQMTAWYMELDILILTTSSLQNAPFLIISGQIENTGGNSNGPSILLGNYTNIHYQSLLNHNQEQEMNPSTWRIKKSKEEKNLLPL